MKGRYEMRLAGSGGQGVISASIILADAAVRSGLYAAQSQSYGPEARGGLCKAEVVISDAEILYPKVKKPTFLLALTQESLDKYEKDLAEGAIVLADSSLCLSQPPISLSELPDFSAEDPDEQTGIRYVSLPILETAIRKIGKPMTSNIVAVGAINALLQLFGQKEMEESVRKRIPAGTEEINLQALKEGADLVNNPKILPFM